MSHTKEQETIVLKVLSYKPHQYYEILSVTKSASDGEIKKSYRKLAVKLHPDKNPHPRASEAFKYLNKAWSVLGDETKKRIYDQTGSDPDARGGMGGGGASAAASGFARSPFGAGGGGSGGFDDDIFNMFFGGNGAGGAGGPSFGFGNNGFTFQTFGGGEHPFFTNARQFRTGNQARQQHQEQQRRRGGSQAPEPSMFETIKQLLPILLLLLVPILSAFFSDDNSTPDYSFSHTRKYNLQRHTPNHNIPFYVNEQALAKKGLTPHQLRAFESKVESLYVQDKRSKCAKEQLMKNELADEAQGWFSVDMAKLARANNMPMPNCQKLRDLNLL